MATPPGYVLFRRLIHIVFTRLCLISIILGSLVPTGAQTPPSISTSLPVPPLQWLNITGLLGGSPPVPLMDSSMGYDEFTRSVVIFGGESQGGLPQQNTYLINLDSMSWATPLNNIPQFSKQPPVRSRALGTGDFAANSRRDFVLYGGQGASNEALGDVWAYNFLNQFWAQVAVPGPAPPPRWGTFGGIDPTIIASSGNNVSTVFNIAGGSNAGTVFASSELWQLNITGTLASDITTIQGVWKNISLSTVLSGKVDAGGALVPHSQARPARIAISGGCGSNANPLSTNVSCVDPVTYVLNTPPTSSVTLGQCPAPRLGPVMVPNLSSASSSFPSQTFMLLGIFDTSLWNDNGGLAKGEVAVLDVDAGTWARILPAPDPSSGNSFPEPRQGAAAITAPLTLVGQDRNIASDTIIFGGRDAQGNYLNDVWILRAYNGSVKQTGEQWSGYGNGQLTGGINADGAGVIIQYMSQCATPIASNVNTTHSGSTSLPAPTSSSSSSGSKFNTSKFDTSIIHKTLSPASIAITLPAILLVRLAQPSVEVDRQARFIFLAIPICIAAYGIGLAGFAVSFTSATVHSVSPAIRRRDVILSNTFLQTGHGRAGFILFICLYAVVPILAFGLWLSRQRKRNEVPRQFEGNSAKHSQDIVPEKYPDEAPRAASPSLNSPEVQSTNSSAPGRRARSLSGRGLFTGWRSRVPSDTSVNAPSVSKGFEVVNRPRRVSAGMAHRPPTDILYRPRDLIRSLNEASWLDRRRTVGIVGELDYALSQLGNSPRSVSPPPTSRPPTVLMSTRPLLPTPLPPPPPLEYLNPCDIFLHILFHTFLLSCCILTLIVLFLQAPIAAFIVFLIWTLAFYISLFYLAWRGRPRASVLTVVLSRLRGPPPNVTPPPPPPDDTPTEEPGSHDLRLVNSSTGPYTYHQHPWRRAISPDEEVMAGSSHGRMAADDDGEDDDNEDEDTRQRRMEEELERRDVHIITVPKRRLWVTNPSLE